MIRIWEDAQHHTLLENSKLQQWDTSTHLLECLKSKTITAGVDMEQQKVVFTATAGGNAKWCFHFRQFVSCFTKWIILFISKSSNHTPWSLTRWVKNKRIEKTSMWIFTVTLFIIAKTYVTKRYFIGEWISVIHPDNGMLVLKRNELTYCGKDLEGFKYIFPRERSQSEYVFQNSWDVQ